MLARLILFLSICSLIRSKPPRSDFKSRGKISPIVRTKRNRGKGYMRSPDWFLIGSYFEPLLLNEHRIHFISLFSSLSKEIWTSSYTLWLILGPLSEKLEKCSRNPSDLTIQVRSDSIFNDFRAVDPLPSVGRHE